MKFEKLGIGKALIGPRPLMWPVPPIAGESLMGWNVRAADDSLHERSVTIMTAAGARHHCYFDIAARDDFDAASLALILGSDESEVRLRMHKAEGNVHGAPRVSFFGASIPRHDLIFRRRLVSPAALKVSPHHHALANHSLIPFCPVSGEVLIGICPFCPPEKVSKLGWYRTNGIAFCDYCKSDLRKALTSSIDPILLKAAQPLIGLLNPDRIAQSEALAHLPEILRSQNRGVLFELGWRLGRIALTGVCQKRDAHKMLPLADIVKTLGKGVSMLATWPQSLDDLIRENMGEKGAIDVVEVASAYRSLAGVRTGWPEHAILMKRDAPHLLLTSQITLRSLTVDGLNGQEAARFLGIGTKAFITLHRKVQFPTVFERGVCNVHATFPAAALAPIRDIIASRISAGAVSEALGISLHGVEQLLCLHLLDAVDHPVTSLLYSGLQIDRDSFRKLQSALSPQLRLSKNLSPLCRALSAVGGREKPWGHIIAALISGDLPFALASKEGRFTDRIRINGADIYKFARMKFDRNDFPEFPVATTMTRRDAQETLNLTPRIMGVAIDEDFSDCRAAKKQLEVGAVLRIASERVSGSEILARWGGGGHKHPPLFIAPDGPQRLGMSGWSRPAVEQTLGHNLDLLKAE